MATQKRNSNNCGTLCDNHKTALCHHATLLLCHQLVCVFFDFKHFFRIPLGVANCSRENGNPGFDVTNEKHSANHIADKNTKLGKTMLPLQFKNNSPFLESRETFFPVCWRNSEFCVSRFCHPSQSMLPILQNQEK